MTLLLPPQKMVCFSTPWIWAWSSYLLLKETGKCDTSKGPGTGKHLCTGAYTLLLVSGILRMPCKEAGLPCQRWGHRWGRDELSLRTINLLTVRNQSEAVLDHPASDGQAQTRRPSWHTELWETTNVYFKLLSFEMVCFAANAHW